MGSTDNKSMVTFKFNSPLLEITFNAPHDIEIEPVLYSELDSVVVSVVERKLKEKR